MLAIATSVADLSNRTKVFFLKLAHPFFSNVTSRLRKFYQEGRKTQIKMSKLTGLESCNLLQRSKWGLQVDMATYLNKVCDDSSFLRTMRAAMNVVFIVDSVLVAVASCSLGGEFGSICRARAFTYAPERSSRALVAFIDAAVVAIVAIATTVIVSLCSEKRMRSQPQKNAAERLLKGGGGLTMRRFLPVKGDGDFDRVGSCEGCGGGDAVGTLPLSLLLGKPFG